MGTAGLGCRGNKGREVLFLEGVLAPGRSRIGQCQAYRAWGNRCAAGGGGGTETGKVFILELRVRRWEGTGSKKGRTG